MYPAQLLTHDPQWPSSGVPAQYRNLPPPWRTHQYLPYHSPATMGKKNPAPQQPAPQPANSYVTPHLRNHPVVEGRQEGAVQTNYSLPQHSVSQPGFTEILKSWYGYGNDNINLQAVPANQSNPYFTLPQSGGPQPQLPQQRPLQRYPPHQPRGSNTQVDNYRPGSRYSPPQTRSQRRANHELSADQPIPSIENAAPTTNIPPWRLPLRNGTNKSYSNRRSMSTTPGIPARPVTPPVAPTPTTQYLQRALEAPERAAQPKKLLMLLDLNGTLLYRPRIPDGMPSRGRREHILRPGARKLIEYLFENHAVMVYTSAMKHNAHLCVEALLRHLSPEQRSKLIDIRPRESLGLTSAQLNAKVQVYKPLEPVWMLQKVLANGKETGCKWDDTNTVLLDDSFVKAVGNPHSLLQVPEFTLPDGTKEHNISPETEAIEEAIMQQVQQKLEILKWEVSVTRKIREWQETKQTLVDAPQKERRASKSESKAASDTLAAAHAKADVGAASYPTPESIVPGEDNEEESDKDGGVRLKSPSPVVEKDFDFVDGSKKREAGDHKKGYLDLSQ